MQTYTIQISEKQRQLLLLALETTNLSEEDKLLQQMLYYMPEIEQDNPGVIHNLYS